MRRATGHWQEHRKRSLFLSTLSLRRATNRRPIFFRQKSISIHALLAESDAKPAIGLQLILHFYPRSPCGERPMLIVWLIYSTPISIHALLAESDIGKLCTKCILALFLSTLSLRRATISDRRYDAKSEFLSTLSLRRATKRFQSFGGGKNISIHALLAESDSARPDLRQAVQHFYPRSPCGERLLHAVDKLCLLVISIHALLAESDLGF